jgi:hypothetical protein
MLSRALPALVAVALVGVLGTDVAVAIHVRAEDRAAAAAAAERHAAAVYRDRIRPIAEQVYDEVQPLQDAVESFEKPGTDVAQIAEDVLSHSGAADAVTARRGELAKVTTPVSMRSQRDRMLDALDIMVTATTQLASTKTQADYSNLNAASSVLGSGILAWSTALTALYGDKGIPSRPVGGGTLLSTRQAASRSTMVAGLDRVCSAAADAGAGLPPIDSPQQFIQAAPRYTKLMRNTVRGLQAVAIPPSQRARVSRDISPNFARANKMADGIDSVMTAIGSGDPSNIRRALGKLAIGMRGSQALSVSLRRYGATVCADFFEIPADVIREATGDTSDAAVAT